MKIAIDARMMGPENTRGIGRYLEELVRAMIEIAPEDEFVLIVRKRFEAPEWQKSHIKQVVADIPWYGSAEHREMPKIFASIGADIVHVPHWNVPLLYRGPLVVTIHDLLLRHQPMSAKSSTRGWLTRWMKRIGFRLTLGHAVRAANIILVPTQFVAQDVVHFYPSEKSKIVVTGEGMPRIALHCECDEHRHFSAADSRLGHVQRSSPEKCQCSSHSRFHIAPFSYLLYVGSAYPHKGLNDALEAWKTLAEQYPDLSFVIAGEKDVFMKRLETEVEREKLPRVNFLGRVSDAELSDLYEGALAFIYPTHFEGFGLPPLEALAHGCPVISSDAGPLREVLGDDGAIFFRPGDAGGIIESVSRVVNDPALARQHAAASAQTLAVRHDWKTAARRTLEAYARVVKQRRHGIQTGPDIGRSTSSGR